MPREKRDTFVDGLDFEPKDATKEKCEVLFYVGSIASYYERNQRTSQAIARILNAANIDFGILGAQEEDSGGDVKELGEEGLFEELAERNLELFRKYGIKKIVCLSPHDYNTFRNYYPEVLKENWTRTGIEVQHYTEFIAGLIDNRKLKIKRNFNQKVTFHDPCNLGRINNVYDAPRKLIKAVGANLIEMQLSHSNSYCCGGGGGNLWYEPLSKPRIQNQRAKQALSTGAEIIAVACPVCTQMLEDGIEAIEGEMRVMDIAEIVEETMGLKP
jgi:Fe-S oxidoreductase